MKPLILICTQDAELYLLLGHILEVDGFKASLADGISEALQQASDQDPRSIILDCRPDSFSSAELCIALKQDQKTKHIAMIGLISPGAEKQHFELLKAGIDESLIRPVAPAKLLDFLRSKLLSGGRASNSVDMSGSGLRHGDIEMSLSSHRVFRNGIEINLGPTEFRMLHQFLQHPGRVFSRGDLIKAAWPRKVHVGPRTVDVHIGRLRKALKAAAKTDAIRTVRAAGYALSDDVE